MEEEDLLGLLDSEEKPFQEADKKPANKPFNKSGTGGNDLWSKTEFTPKKLNLTDMKRSGKSFTIYYQTSSKDVPDDAKEKLIKFAKALISKGYVFRHNGSPEDGIQNAILTLDGCVSQTYLPWKKFNINIKEPYLDRCTEDAYSVAFNNHKVFSKLPPTVRCILSRDVHVLTGKNVNDPVDVVFTYSKAGHEAITKNVDYKELGSLSFIYRVIQDLNVTVFNVKNDDASNRLLEYLKNVN